MEKRYTRNPVLGVMAPTAKATKKWRLFLASKSLSIVGQDTTKKSDEQLLKVIAEGAGKMPASKLTKDEQKQVLGYSKTLAK